jgi:2-alkenal reductase
MSYTSAMRAVVTLVLSLAIVACSRPRNDQTAQPTPAAAPTALPTTAPITAPTPVNPASATPTRNTPAATANRAAATGNPAAAVYQMNGASVVNITSLAVVRTRQGQSAQPQGIGSGFMLDSDGRIVTNNHVVQDAAQLNVTFQDKSTVPATLVGRDPDNDLAVIQVDPNTTDDQGASIRSRIKPVTLGDSDDVIIGETVVAIGSPLGLQQTVTQGIVSARRTPGEDTGPAGDSLDLIGGAIQTDAAINPGNSGGPLFNAAGMVIGVNSAILSQSGGNEGIGFAIPINVVKRVSPELIANGRYRHPLLGVSTLSIAQIGTAAKQQLGIPPNVKGLLVVEVSAGAQQAGIQPGTRQINIGGDMIPTGGDIIVAIDGQPIGAGGDLRAYIENNKHPGESAVITIVRNGQRQDVAVTLSERPAQAQTSPTRR